MKSIYRFNLLQTAIAMAVSPMYMADATSSILSATLDDLPDLPGFKVPPTGAYAVSIVSILEKKVGEHPAVEVKFKILEVLEVTETGIPDAELPLKEDEFSLAYMLDNDTGVGFLKQFLKPLAEALQTPKAPLTDIMTNAKNMALQLILKRTADKDDEDKKYIKIKKMSVL